MRRLLMIPFLLVFAGCGDNFDRDELLSGPRTPDGTTDADSLTTE